MDTWTYGHALIPDEFVGRRIGWTDTWFRSHAGRQPVRQPRQRPALRARHEHHGTAPHRGHLRGVAPDGDGRVRAVARPRPDPAHGRAAPRHRPVGRPVVHPRRQRAALAELVDAGRLQLPRGTGPAPRRLRRRRPHPLDRAPAVVRRDDRPLPRPRRRPLPADGVRHRRVGPRLHDHVARTRLRLPRRDHLRRRRAARLRGANRARSRTRSAFTRRTTRCCGSTSTPTRAPRSGGRAGWSSRSTPRWPTTSTSSTGASTKTARSSARSGPPGSWSSATSTNQPPPYGTLVDERTYAPFHQHFIVARLDMEVDGADNTVVESHSEALPDQRRQSVRARARAAQHPVAHRGGGQAGLRLGHPARLEGGQHEPAQRSRHARVVQAGAGRCVPADDRRGVTGLPARRGHRAHAVGDTVR